MTSTCTAASALSDSTTITNGMLQTYSGDDRNGDGDTTDPGEHAPVTVPVPANPGPNTSYSGHIHVNGAQDNFEYNFNTQVLNPDGSLTVNAAHERFLGPTVVGDLFVGEAQCGLTGASNGTGTTGTTGTTGPAGPTGPAGQNGTNGANGSKGDRGEKGDTVAGPPGPAGPGGVGPAGPSGAAGPPGPRGLSGTLNVAVTRFRAPPRRSRRRAGDGRPSAFAHRRRRRPTGP